MTSPVVLYSKKVTLLLLHRSLVREAWFVDYLSLTSSKSFFVKIFQNYLSFICVVIFHLTFVFSVYVDDVTCRHIFILRSLQHRRRRAALRRRRCRRPDRPARAAAQVAQDLPEAAWTSLVQLPPQADPHLLENGETTIDFL